MARIIGLLLITLIATITVYGQDDTCSALVESALKSVSEVCNETGRNQVCYGNIQLVATAFENSSDVTLDSPGDMTDIAHIDTLQLSSLNLPDNWGVALMKIQANLPDTLPGQNVTILLFGDVNIEEQVSKLPNALPGTVITPANVRRGPSTNYGLLGSVSDGTVVEVDARNADSDWVRIYRSDTVDLAWISSSLLLIDGDVSNLPVVDVADPIASNQFGPMQSFLFRSGIGTGNCEEAPPDGILVQTPQGVREINLLVNQVDIRLGSTAFITAVPNGFLTITLLEGQGKVTAKGLLVTVPAGLRARVPLGDDGLPIGPPELVIYEQSEVRALPISNLDEPFDLPEPRPLSTPIPAPTAVPNLASTTEDTAVADVAAVSVAVGDSGTYAGDWYIAASPAASCSTGAKLISENPLTPMLIEESADGLSYFGRDVVETSPGVFKGTTAWPRGDVDYNTLTFTSPNTATWMMSVDTTGTDVFPCKEVVTVVMQLFR